MFVLRGKTIKKNNLVSQYSQNFKFQYFKIILSINTQKCWVLSIILSIDTRKCWVLSMSKDMSKILIKNTQEKLSKKVWTYYVSDLSLEQAL